jgi:hypothetical protein
LLMARLLVRHYRGVVAERWHAIEAGAH